jgi:hypothetical protein
MAISAFLAFPIAYFFLKLGYSPISVFVGILAGNTMQMGTRIYFAKRLCHISLRNYFTNMLKIILLVSISASATYALSRLSYPSPWLRRTFTTALSTTLMPGVL